MGKRSKTQVIDGERHRILRKTFTRVIKFMTYDKDSSVQGLPWWLSGKGSTYQRRRLRFHPWVRKIPWRRKWQPTLVFLPGELHGQSSLVGYSLWGCKESDMTRGQRPDQTETTGARVREQKGMY